MQLRREQAAAVTDDEEPDVAWCLPCDGTGWDEDADEVCFVCGGSGVA